MQKSVTKSLYTGWWEMRAIYGEYKMGWNGKEHGNSNESLNGSTIRALPFLRIMAYNEIMSTCTTSGLEGGAVETDRRFEGDEMDVDEVARAAGDKGTIWAAGVWIDSSFDRIEFVWIGSLVEMESFGASMSENCDAWLLYSSTPLSSFSSSSLSLLLSSPSSSYSTSLILFSSI